MSDVWVGLWMNWVFVYSNEEDVSYYVHKGTKRECKVHYDPFATGFEPMVRRHPRAGELRRCWRHMRRRANVRRLREIASLLPGDPMRLIGTYL